MCTSIVEVVSADGAGKGGDGWFALTHSVVSYDHPHHAVLEEAITIDFVNAALGLRVREVAVLSNVIFGVLLVFCGVNVAVSDLPGWMQPISNALPLTHGIEAARRLADGAAVGGVAGLLGVELAIGAAYMALGYGMLRFFETMSRRHATLDRA
jgi:ABC-2 type transport system permease protein